MENKQADWDWLGFLLSWHEKEYERRYTLENVVATPIGVLTGVYALAYVLFTQYDYKHSDAFSMGCFLLPLLVAVFFAFLSAAHVYRSYAVVKNRIYRGIPDPVALREHMDQLVAYHSQQEPSQDATQNFKEYFVKLLADQITTNVVNNDERTRDIQKAKPPLRNCLLALCCVLPAFLYNQQTKPEPIYQVVSLPTNASPTANKPTPSPPSSAPTPTRPTAPSPPRERQIQEAPKPKKR